MQDDHASRLPRPRVVLHVDLDAFFVQVERKLNPTLIGKPMAVQQHADIIAVSYEARALGVKKHMPVSAIRREHPTVKLVHVETIGLHNDKVSYRSYRAAARAIFTLVRAFCPPEGRSNANYDHGTFDRRPSPKPNSGKPHNGKGGKFQKASIDEAYLEPTRRTLLAELRLSSQRDKNGPSATANFRISNTIAAAEAAIAPEPPLTGTKRARGGKNSESGGCPSVLVEPAVHQWRSGDDSCGRGPSQSRDGDDSGEGNRWNMLAECSPDDDGPPNEWARRRSPRTRKDEEEGEEDRLLEAGGLLATRIQQTLSDVLQYDCSIGVASNKFLAKLVTNLAKPKGVRVLLRRDVASLLASTPATKIPGCGAGSVAARQFGALGVNSIVDLRRIQAAELRERLGEQLGVKVCDRCRGVDHDPVEPDPTPSRISSQLSLVPLITPAHCLGKPGEKLIPVFPWELERVRPFLATLVDDLIDRAKEELAERSRRPTKLCIEHHLHQRGSKSQTFVLPAPTPSRPCQFTAPTAGDPPAGVVAGQQPNAGTTPESGGQEKHGDILVIPSAAALIELALTPFKKYRQSRRTADGGELHVRAAAGLGGSGAAGAGEIPHQKDTLPPVVKLIVSLLAFETVGPEPPTAAPPGQRTLRDMRWLKNATPTSGVALAEGPDGGANPPPSGSKASGVSAGATAVAAIPEIVAPSPVARVTPAGNPGSSTHDASGRPKPGEPALGSRNSIPRLVEEVGSVLVRCPRCKACLPVGEAWDVHREEHLLVGAPSDHHQPATARRITPAYHDGGSSSPLHFSTIPPQYRPFCSPELVGAADGTRRTSVGGNVGRFGGDFVDLGDSTPPSDADVRTPVQGAAGGSSDGDAGRRQSRKLSHLLMIAVTPEQTAGVLGDRGFLRDDGQTRFANLGLVGKDLPREQQEEVALNE